VAWLIVQSDRAMTLLKAAKPRSLQNTLQKQKRPAARCFCYGCQRQSFLMRHSWGKGERFKAKKKFELNEKPSRERPPAVNTKELSGDIFYKLQASKIITPETEQLFWERERKKGWRKRWTKKQNCDDENVLHGRKIEQRFNKRRKLPSISP